MTDEGYNGYTNYETWLLCLNIDNEQGIYNEINALVQENKDCEDYDLGDKIREMLEEYYSIDDLGIVKICDTWTWRDWKEINWTEVAQCHRPEEA